MPPRRGGAQNEDARRKQFEDWDSDPANTLCIEIQKIRKNESHELNKFNAGTDDIVGDWKDVLEKMFKLSDALRIPGRKPKNFEQHIFRTMCFFRLASD